MVLNLSGIGDFFVVSGGCNSEMILISNWLYFSFLGDFLLVKWEVSELGFQVYW